MAVWQITVRGKGVRRDTVDKITRAITDKLGDKTEVSVRDATPPASRPDRFSAAMSLVSDARGECEGLRDELEEWKSNMPENLQEGSKAGEIDEAVSTLEDLIQNLEDLEGTDVPFPSMM